MKRLISKLTKKPSLVYASILGLTPLLWFFQRPGALITGSDTNFPLDPEVWFMRRLFTWNPTANAGADFSSSTAGLFFHLIQLIPYKLGLTLIQVEMVSLVFWFLLISLGAYFLSSRLFPKSGMVQMLFTTLYTFNIYIFNTWENVKVSNLALVASMPYGLYLLVSLNRNKINLSQAFFCSCLVGIILSGSGINPAYFLTFFVSLVIFSLPNILLRFNLQKIKLTLKSLSIIAIPILLINSFWLFPTVNYIFRSITASGSIYKIGYVNWVDSLSKNTSILNVVRMQGAWDWYAFDDLTGLPLYIPYALNYFFKFPFLVFSFLIPSLVLLSLVFINKRKLGVYLSFTLMFAIGVFLGAGTHLPTGNIYRFLHDNLPFFTLFRSPWYIFAPLISLSTAGLVSLFIYDSIARYKRNTHSLAILWSLFAVVLIVGNLLYTYPLITGKIFRPSMPDNFLIKFPSYVFDTQEFLRDKNGEVRIIGYPDDEIERFMWGYNGIDSILGIFSKAEHFYYPLNAPESPVAQLLREFYQDIKKSQMQSASAIAQKLKVSLIFDKRDQKSFSSDISSNFSKDQTKSFGEWNFYQVLSSPVDKIFATNKTSFAYPYSSATTALSVVNKEVVLINPQDSELKRIQPLVDMSSQTVMVAQSSQYKDLYDFLYKPARLSTRLAYRDLKRVVFNFNTPKSGEYKPMLERYALESFGLLGEEEMSLNVDGKGEVWKIEERTASYVSFLPRTFSAGDHRVVIELSNPNLVSGGDLEGGEIYQKEGDGEFRIIETGDNHYLSIVNKSDKDVSAKFSPTTFDPLAYYLVQFDYRHVYGGDNAAVLMQQSTKTSNLKAQLEGLPFYPEWGTFSLYYEPVRASSGMSIGLIAPSIKDALGSKTLFDNVSIYKVFTNNLILVQTPQPTLSTAPTTHYQQKSPVHYEVEVTNGQEPHALVFAENYSPEWEVKTYDIEGNRLNVSPVHFTADMYANGWYIGDAPDRYKAVIYYKPQRLANIGRFIAALTFFSSVLLVLYSSRRSKR